MALILSIESATSICSVALHREGKLLRLSELDQENTHAKQLMLLVEGMFNESGLKPSDLSAVAISSGPGSYTGLRIGVSVAKGLAFAFNIPLIAVDTLEALAFQAFPLSGLNDFVIPLLDARRMEVYTSIFGFDGKLIESSHPLEIEGNPFLNYLNTSKVFFLGDGLKKLLDILDHENSIFLPNLNSASSIGFLAYKKFINKSFEDIAYFEPNYLKEFRVLASKKNPLLI
ncbi:tRNA (adenosine(37)-N6)-threonylcarbamoyltransferase complex dimerization subunit type 1 TsaB [Aquiflexum sp. LQ15W]|uniref:tRNA (adenosine(37)-N6)-threonylcarbamoyltransferase complex dimerization subunit type 1 TsaB n=1 Tax=Cognataquiflexum nitidum TaxID=2922272 RepID=UPI001F1470ED|nr:tRNA (adenosine(37)-N6)-threonylcarbamoyltransferase complex dimerization subunit type 1 TsaB [Cognataquiflexum nitidum]MCH6201433.1 tRNA (adenosine(37)-N6)-threonylcarbamoyltransferase complex dimerization subunit type 1 TsaB [Cognataquiflexum nitidum]